MLSSLHLGCRRSLTRFKKREILSPTYGAAPSMEFSKTPIQCSFILMVGSVYCVSQKEHRHGHKRISSWTSPSPCIVAKGLFFFFSVSSFSIFFVFLLAPAGVFAVACTCTSCAFFLMEKTRRSACSRKKKRISSNLRVRHERLGCPL